LDIDMATASQIAANRRNAQRSTGPRTAKGKAAVRLNAVQHGMTAKTVVLPHEPAADYHEIRAALMADYAPASSQELMLVDQIAAGYWRTIRARRFETAMFDNQLRARKREAGKDDSPNPATDDEGCVVMLQVETENTLRNYFRYDGAISRDYFRAVNALERMQANRRREEDREERQAPVTKVVKPTGFVSYSKSVQSCTNRTNAESERGATEAPREEVLSATNNFQFTAA
jgi:hypothetical protein